MTPLLSIIIPHYNHEKTLPRALDSILAQSIKNVEVIIVDDISEYPCASILEMYQDKGLNIKFIKNKQRLLTMHTRLAGVQAASAPAITFLDADDTFYGTECIEKCTQLCIDNQVDIVHFNTIRNGDGNNLEEFSFWHSPFAQYVTGKEVFQSFVSSSCRAHTVWGKVYSHSVWNRILPFASNCNPLRYLEDFFLFSLIAAHSESYTHYEYPGYLSHYINKDILKDSSRIQSLYRMLECLPPLFSELGHESKTIKAYSKRLCKTMIAVGERVGEVFPEKIADEDLENLTRYGDKKLFALALLTAIKAKTPTQKKKKPKTKKKNLYQRIKKFIKHLQS